MIDGDSGTAAGALARQGRSVLGEVACRYRVGEVDAAQLPMIAAEALAAGLDGPTLCELAGRPRNADGQELRDEFERAPAECGIALPDLALAGRHALRRTAARFLAGEVPLADLGLADLGLADLGLDDLGETGAQTAQERAFVRLIPQCTCCLAYTLGLDQQAEWEAELRAAALALVSSTPAEPGC
ncbi:hypothetical protein [Kitasatospora sp. NBC_01300]|uniref:hypothetical protein n=1 Tax=Kitasatospora sp. NBC_01300 TaxID=2903574 RepID=UPI00352BD1C1|nr:hypothetical protein OG556_01010 [Kitasatospora sp. NBC_01300]WSK08236.1 hypothetical protein OG556_32710 [Kitasatospora sp. NBC_01300]